MIKLAVFDIDGVLTDGSIYISENGQETKRFRLTEIDALNSIVDMGVKIAAITGENTSIVELFKKKALWSAFFSGCKDKLQALKGLQFQLDTKCEEILYIGDGKYDVEPIKYAGVGACPANAIQEVRDVADLKLSGCGGESCIYELYQWLKRESSTNQ